MKLLKNHFISSWLCGSSLPCRLPPAAVTRGSSLAVVCGLLTAVASLDGEHGLWVLGPSSCSVQAWLLCCTWDLPGPGIKPVSPASAGRLFRTESPEKPSPRGVICYMSSYVFISAHSETQGVWTLCLESVDKRQKQSLCLFVAPSL